MNNILSAVMNSKSTLFKVFWLNIVAIVGTVAISAPVEKVYALAGGV